MKQLILIVLVLALGCRSEKKVEQSLLSATEAPSKDTREVEMPIEVFDFEGLKPLLHQTDDKIHVINFWATWCAPCIKELPYFERVGQEQAGTVEVTLVSLDMPGMWKKQLLPFIEKKKLQSTVVVLDDPKQNIWIPQIDDNWSGAIPATLIYTKNQRRFYEKPFTYEELVAEIDTFK
ncbi:MAG: TlpA family protein disulfide reductase [Flavobacteriaceae bacterium]